ncbi:MAG TPA: PPOX class F420-dependent oxidoreductase [Nitrososphaerales archaeon]|nr:PPOX class F420-dependent oxidoreductase [Nitrososphaerales archaeon]
MALRNWEYAVRLIEGKNFANLGTLMPDGSPQVTPVWVDRENDLVLVNTAEGRVKLENVTRDPRVAISIFEQDDPYNKVLIRGTVVKITKDGAEDHIDKMAMKYRGLAKYPWRQPGISRVLIKIRPTRISK